MKRINLKGIVAYKGNVKGKAKKIFSNKDVEKFQEGYILVSEYTHPEHLLAMVKSAGILTETGSLLCHTAITGRELKIPCIVRVKGLLDAVDDEDVVEFNEKGDITIFKSDSDENS